MSRLLRFERSVLLVLAAALAVWVSPSFAQSGWLLGLDLGPARAEDWCKGVPNNVVGSTLDCRDRGVAAKLNTGYQFHRVIALEVGLVHASGFKTEFNPPTAALTKSSLTLFGLTTAVVTSIPLGPRANLTLKGGMTRLRASVSGTTPTSSFNSEAWNNRPVAGLGFSYALDNNTSFRAQWERYFRLRIEDSPTSFRTDVDLLSVGVTHRFD